LLRRREIEFNGQNTRGKLWDYFLKQNANTAEAGLMHPIVARTIVASLVSGQLSVFTVEARSILRIFARMIGASLASEPRPNASTAEAKIMRRMNVSIIKASWVLEHQRSAITAGAKNT
jgi:hypothetical protein